MKYIAPHVRRLDASNYAHVYLIESDHLVLVDSGFWWNGMAVWNELKQSSRTAIRAIVLTHHDPDHAGSAAYLQKKTGAPVYLGAEDIPFYHGAAKMPAGKNWTGLLARTRCPGVLLPIQEENIFNIEVIHAPGHTPGHTIFRFDGVLFCGDLFANKHGRPSNLTKYHADARRNAVSLLAAADLEVQMLCPAHGEPLEWTPAAQAALRALTEV